MDFEILPAINAVTFEEVTKKIRLIEPYVSWAHLDVADGTFTKNILWHDAKDLRTLVTPLFIEVHLMIDNVDEHAGEWLLPNVRRVIFHVEASHDPKAVIKKCHEANTEAGMALCPDTPVDVLFPYLTLADMVQTLAVMPGRSGQVFQNDTLEKIKALRSHTQSGVIEVDGGVNSQTIGQICRAGASVLVAGSAIFESGKDIKSAIEELRRYAREH